MLPTSLTLHRRHNKISMSCEACSMHNNNNNTKFIKRHNAVYAYFVAIQPHIQPYNALPCSECTQGMRTSVCSRVMRLWHSAVDDDEHVSCVVHLAIACTASVAPERNWKWGHMSGKIFVVPLHLYGSIQGGPKSKLNSTHSLTPKSKPLPIKLSKNGVKRIKACQRD